MVRTGIITGASKGIGRAIAKELVKAKKVDRLILVARDIESLRKLANELECDCIPIKQDLSNITESAKLYLNIWKAYGPIDLLINCAGVAFQGSFFKIKPKNMATEINLNTLAMYTSIRIIGRLMKGKRQGTIINVSSLMAKIPAPDMATYSATKASMLAFTHALRQELRQNNVRVIALLPPLTRTGMIENIKIRPFIQMLEPEIIAKALIKGLNSGQDDILVGQQARLLLLFKQFLPGLFTILTEAIDKWYKIY